MSHIFTKILNFQEYFIASNKMQIWGINLEIIMKIINKKRIVLLLCIGLVMSMFSFTKADDKLFEIARNIDLFASVYKEINTFYVDEINPSKSIRTGIDQMLEALDPYTNYIAEDEIEDWRTATGCSFSLIFLQM